MSTKESQPARYTAARAIGSVWWYFLIRSLLLLIAGGFMLFKPDLTLVAFTQVIGVLVIMDGILAFVAAFTGQVESRFWALSRGGIMLAAGLFVFLQPALVSSIAIKTVLFIVAPFVILSGVLEIVGSVRGRDGPPEERKGWFSGLLTTLFGILLIVAPLFFGELLVRLLGIFAILMAIPLLLLALKFRKAGKRLEVNT